MPTNEPTVAEDFSAVERALEPLRRTCCAAHRAEFAAERRAQQLLYKHLTPRQRGEYEQSNGEWFIVRGSVYDYRLRRCFTNNIDVFTKAGKRTSVTMCAYARGVPDGDHRLAQKLAIEIEEDKFTRVGRGTLYSL